MDEQFNEQFANDWGKQWQQEIPDAGQNVIPFQAGNKYLETADRVNLTKQLIDDGKAQEGIVCLQAEVQKNPENAEAWRLMGQLY